MKKRRHWFTLGAAGTIMALLVGGCHVWMTVRQVVREHREEVQQANQRLYNLEVMVCGLSSGRWERGECRIRHR